MIAVLFSSLALFILVLIAIAVIRIAIGPTMPDRLVGMDTANTLMVSALIVLAAAYNQVIYIDIAIVYAMLSFVGTLFFAKYLEGAK